MHQRNYQTVAERKYMSFSFMTKVETPVRREAPFPSSCRKVRVTYAV